MSWMRRIRRNTIRNTIKTAALGFAAIAVCSPSAPAMARHDSGSASQSSVAVQQEGVTPTNLARAYVAKSDAVSVAQPDGYQPQLRGSEPVVIRDAPDGYQPQTRGTEVSAASSGSSVDWGNVAFGLGLGIGIAALCALMLLERARPRTVGA